MIEKPPNFDLILRTDLQNDDRLAELLVQAVRRKLWPNNSPKDVLDFWSLAEKALHDDSLNTPGRLFRNLVQNRHTDRITNACEKRAQKRLNSQNRHELYIRAGVKPNPLMPDGDPSPGLSLAPHHIGYQHGVFMMCPFPQQRLPTSQRDWFVEHNRKTIAVSAGCATLKGQVKRMEIPYGFAPRLLFPYIIARAIKDGRKIDLGKNLWRFIESLGMTPNGNKYRVFTEQLRNVAAVQISVHTTRFDASTGENEVLDRYYRVVAGHSRSKLVMFDRSENPPLFMLPGCGRKSPLPIDWNSEFYLTHDFYEFVKENAVPVNMQHLVRLARSPRRMDLYNWLSYRTPWIPEKKQEEILLSSVQHLFAPDLDPKSYRKFKQIIRDDIAAIRQIHSGFDVQISGDFLILRKSAPAVPFTQIKRKRYS